MAAKTVQEIPNDASSNTQKLLVETVNNLIRAIFAGPDVATIKTNISAGGLYECKIVKLSPNIPLAGLPSTTQEA